MGSRDVGGSDMVAGRLSKAHGRYWGSGVEGALAYGCRSEGRREGITGLVSRLGRRSRWAATRAERRVSFNIQR